MIRRPIAALSLALPLLAAAQGRPVDLERALVASYPLDGGAVDQVTHGRAAAVATRPFEDRTGARGGALWFDGARSFVKLGAALQPARFTLSAWIRPESVDRVQAIVSKIRNLPGHYQKNLELRLEAGGRLFLHVPSGAGWEGVTGGLPIPAQRWTHVAATYDGARAQLYVDGAPDGAPLAVVYAQSQTETFLGARPEGGGNDGRTPSGPSFFFHGGIDDVRIWDRALGEAEIGALAGRVPAAPEPPPRAGPPPPRSRFPAPVAAYALDGDARDAAGGADGTLVGTRPAEDRLGNPRGALNFGGRDHVDLAVRTEPERFSISVWVRPGRVNREQVIFSKLSTVPNVRHKWLELGLDTFGRLALTVPNASPFRYSATSSARLVAGRWVHVAATFDGDTASLFLDGAPAGQAKVEPFDASPGPVFVGARPEAPGRRARLGALFDGRLDDLRIYRGALAPEEVAAIARGVPEPPGQGGDDDDDVEDLLVQVGKLIVRYDAALVRRDPRRIASVEEKIAREVAGAVREARGDRDLAERLRHVLRELERGRGALDPMSLDRKRSALVDLSGALWTDLAREMDDGPPAPAPPSPGGGRREGW